MKKVVWLLGLIAFGSEAAMIRGQLAIRKEDNPVIKQEKPHDEIQSVHQDK